MNKIKYFLSFAIATLLVSAAPIMASPIGTNFANALDTGALYGTTTQNASAGLNLNLADDPDIFTSFLAASYNAASGALSINGFALTYDDGVSSTGLFDAFSLNAVVDNTGSLAGGANMFAISTLLSGSLLQIGSSTAAMGTLEFLFQVTGGSLANDYGGVGALGGIIMTLIDFPGDWANSWNGTAGVADVAAIAAPEPGILLLGGLGLTLLFVSRRRKI